MNFVRLLAVAVIIVSSVSGCSTAIPEPTASAPAATTHGPVPTDSPAAARMLSGTFVSQAATTRGEVVLTEKPDSATLTLKDFSTGPGEEMYVNLNRGAMTKNPAGAYVVEDPSQIQLAHLKSRTGTQSYDLTPMIAHLGEIQSVTIYSYKTLEAFGTANLLKQ